jgi:hypothetical protein
MFVLGLRAEIVTIFGSKIKLDITLVYITLAELVLFDAELI